jgi:hypothetical protein
MMNAVEIGSDGMTHIPNFMKIGLALKQYQGYYLDNLRGCSDDTTVWEDL